MRSKPGMVSQLTLLFRGKLQTNEENATQNSATAKKKKKTMEKSSSDPSETKAQRNTETEVVVLDNLTTLFSSSETSSSSFNMPLHYPNYTRRDYEDMSEEMLDRLLDIYGLPVLGDLSDKKAFAIGAFLWENHSVFQEQEEASSPSELGYANPTSFIDSDESSTLGVMEVLREMVRYLFRV